MGKVYSYYIPAILGSLFGAFIPSPPAAAVMNVIRVCLVQNLTLHLRI